MFSTAEESNFTGIQDHYTERHSELLHPNNLQPTPSIVKHNLCSTKYRAARYQHSQHYTYIVHNNG